MKHKALHTLAALTLTAAMILTLLTGCGASAAPSASADGGDLREINVVLDWYPNALHTFLYTAMERGYFADEGLKVNVQFPTNTSDALSLVAAGKAELGFYYQQDLIQARANQDVRVKSVGALIQTPLNAIVSLTDAGISSPADLAGKTVGYGGTALSEAMVRAMMEHAGVSPDSVTLQDVGFDLMSAMTTGSVDATIGCMLNHEVPELEHQGFDVSSFALTDYGIPNYYEEILLASDDTIENDSTMLAGFLRACARGFADFKTDPDGCLDLLLARQDADNFPLTEEVERQSCQVLLPAMETADGAFLSQTEAVWQANIDWMYEQGLIDAKPAYADVAAELQF
jgi:putative hydroxymethylpyrimidine transport system substrate-binding protein